MYDISCYLHAHVLLMFFAVVVAAAGVSCCTAVVVQRSVETPLDPGCSSRELTVGSTKSVVAVDLSPTH